MLSRVRTLFHWRSGHGVLFTFVVTILVPGIVIAFIGFRALLQERRLADQQIRENVDRAAELAARDLAHELRQWQETADEVARRGAVPPASWPDQGRLALEKPGSGVVILVESSDLRVFPPGQLLYEPAGAPRTPPPQTVVMPGLTEAESAELRQRDFPRAILLYEQLLASVEPDFRPTVLHRLARTYRKAGHLGDAERAYRELEGAGGDIGALPAELVARFELCSLWEEQDALEDLATGALTLYRGLVSGRWPLEKSRYVFYSSKVRRWLGGDAEERDGAAQPNRAEILRLQTLEEQKLELTRVVDELLASPRRLFPTDTGAHLAFWHDEPFAGLVLSERVLAEWVWPRTFAAMTDQQLDVAVRAANGHLVFGANPDEPPAFTLTRSLQGTELPWQVQVWPRAPEALYADLVRRQNLTLAMLVLVSALLVFGSYLTVRTVRRELEVARLQSEFVSTVSHEFRSPLAGIRQLGEMLMRGRVKSDERAQHYYRLIVRESDRLGRLVENVLNFSRMEDGRKEYRFEPLEPTPWLHELVEDFQTAVAERGISVVARIPESLPVLSGDREALTSAVQNLLDNAVKYGPDSKTVWLDAEARNGSVSIRVRDRGLGISDDDRTRLFEKFYRGSGEITRRVKGVGLGLSLVKQIVTAHGGSIEVDSRLGEGSTFSLSLRAATPIVEG